MARLIAMQVGCRMSRELFMQYKALRDRMKLPLKIFIGVDLFHAEGETMLEVVTIFRMEDEEFYKLAIKHSQELCQIQQNKLQYVQEP